MKYILILVLAIGALSCSTEDTFEEPVVHLSTTQKIIDLSGNESTVFLDSDGNVTNSFSVTSNPYLTDEVKTHLLQNAVIIEDECTGDFHFGVYTDLGSGSTEFWSFGVLNVEQVSSCVKYHSYEYSEMEPNSDIQTK